MNTNHRQIAPIAIIGIGCMFPKAADLKEYWGLLANGEDGITDVPDTHWSAADYFNDDPKKPDHTYCKRGGFLSPVSYDPSEFSIPPNLIEATDTSQLLGLIAAKMALQDAGYGSGKPFDREKTSVILGVTGTQELVIPLGARLGHPFWRKALESSGISSEKTNEVIRKISQSYVPWQENSFPGLLGNVVAGRISNRLNLSGTNTVTDAACASSLSAINLSVLELLAGRCNMAITGGVDALNDIFMHMCFAKTSVLSHTGDARPFSEDADGTVLGEGMGLIVLKRLQDALIDGDRIYALIKGIGSSSDGKSGSIYAPDENGQAKALRMAYRDAGISTDTVELIEAHGTGTRVGDAVEFSALKNVFSESVKNGNKCALGSVKSMIGHTKAAAGAAGLIKGALALHHKVIPPTLKADKPDPKLNITESPFYLNTKTKPWIKKSNHPRRCGVSAFGFGGSNFHVVLEEYESQKHEISWDGTVDITAFSAPDKKGLIDKLNDFKDSIRNDTSRNGISYYTSKTRKEFSQKDTFRLLIVSGKMDSVSNLINIAISAMVASNYKTLDDHSHIYFSESQKPGKLAFIFPGQGSQYAFMGNDLACRFPEAGIILEYANDIFNEHNDNSASFKRLTDYIYPQTPKRSIDEDALRNTDIAQPAIGTVSLFMLKILERFDLQPDAVCGHSFGELTALCSAGWIEEETFLSLSSARGRFMAKTGGNTGTMLAVKAPLDELELLIKKNSLDIVLANRNSYEQGVLSGPEDEILKAEKCCKEKGFRTIHLPVSAAFHSRLVKDAAEPFMKTVKKAKINPSETPVYSNTTGTVYPDDPVKVKELLGHQLLHPVDFVSQIENLYKEGVRTFVEVGPKSILTGLVTSILKGRDSFAVSSDGSSGRRSGVADLAHLLCRLASLGYDVNLENWEDPAREPKKQKMSIPVSGANYSPRPEFEQTSYPEKNEKQERSDQIMISKEKIMNKPMDTYTSKESDIVSDALKVVRESLKSMQVLQTQTAEAHKKFLEAQTEAGRTLQMMLEKTQHMTEAAMGVRSLEHINYNTQLSDAGHETRQPEAPQIDPNTTLSREPVMQSPIDTNTVTSESVSHPATVHTVSNKEIESILLEVVSELTGYPVEMLNADMDIESDLGIDSIKRVEILSTLEEKLPGLPAVSPEIMGELNTLGQICNYLADDSVSSDVSHLTPGSGHNQDEIETVLLEVVSQLTGYPVEMLNADMDIESDLGIDSIKRVEILSTLEEKLPGLPAVSPEIMGELNTLGKICTYLAGSSTDVDTVSEKPIPETVITIPDKQEHENKAETTTADVVRNIILPVKKSLKKEKQLIIPDSRIVYVANDNTGLGPDIVKEFQLRNIRSSLISLNRDNKLDTAGGLVIVSNLKQDGKNKSYDWDPEEEERLKKAFGIAQKSASDLLDSAKKGGALFATITRLDGCFGFKNKIISNPLQGGLAGLAKTASIEWENVHCRAIDVSPKWNDNKRIAKSVVSELLTPASSGSIEVGLDSKSRYETQLTESTFPEGSLNLDKNDVVVITGGARGVTAACACALTREASPIIVLLGRSPLPSPEPSWLEGIDDAALMKKIILENEFSGKNVAPVELEQSYRRYTANREITRNLKKMKTAGSTVLYYSVDVRDSEKTASILDEVRSNHGPVKAFIHGAGVLHDRLIIDKTPEQFETVFDTKVNGLKSLLEATAQDNLSHIVLFSSVAARHGNKGQVDYAMANEVLNKMARKQATQRPDCRVVSINWGPWDGGMVSSALKKEFTKNNIELIPVEAGAACMISEMTGDPAEPVEVVVGAQIVTKKVDEKKSIKTSDREKTSIKKPTDLVLTFKREIDILSYPVLESHKLAGQPVVPFALMTEWFGHSALHGNPGLYFHGIDDMRLLSGIKLDDEKKIIRLMAGKARKNGPVFEVDVEIRNGVKDGKELIHSRARAILSSKLNPPPVYNDSGNNGFKPYTRSIDDVYNKILFHGSKLRGLKEIKGISEKGMKAVLTAAPLPKKWMTNPLRSRWISDPLILDSAFQIASLWCYEQTGVVSLPSYSESYRQYCKEFPPETITAILEVNELTDHKMKGNITFLDPANNVIAEITGYEAVMDISLNKAFKPNGITG